MIQHARTCKLGIRAVTPEKSLFEIFAIAIFNKFQQLSTGC